LGRLGQTKNSPFREKKCLCLPSIGAVIAKFADRRVARRSLRAAGIGAQDWFGWGRGPRKRKLKWDLERSERPKQGRKKHIDMKKKRLDAGTFWKKSEGLSVRHSASWVAKISGGRIKTAIKSF